MIEAAPYPIMTSDRLKDDLLDCTTGFLDDIGGF